MSQSYDIPEYHMKELNRGSTQSTCLTPFLSGSLNSRAGYHVIAAIGHHSDHVFVYSDDPSPFSYNREEERSSTWGKQ